MDVSQQHEVSDIVKYALENQPSKLQDVFNELMIGRVYDSIQQKKVEVAQNYFNVNQPEMEADDHNHSQEEEEMEDGQDSE